MNDITISDGVITNTGTVHVIDTKQQSYYENLVICRKSGQISDQQWEEPLKKLRQFTDLEIAENIQDPNGRFVYVFAEDAQLAVDELQTKLETAENDRNEWRDNAIIS